MISFIQGEILKLLSNPKRIILLVNGIGYEIYIPEYLNNYFMENNISIDSQIELEIYYHVTERQPKPLLVGFISYAEKMSPLGNATALDCANYTVTLFSDLTKRVTLQNLYNDGGFSNVGVSQEIIDIVSSTNKD